MFGPSLFNIYINDATEILQNLLTLYADDSKLIGAASSWVEAASIQADLNKLDDWSRQWYLNLIEVNVKFYILAIKIKNIFTPCKTK